MIYFSSDLHFNHNKDFLYKPRGFDSIDAMNMAVVSNWNSVITNEDDVYILGDLMLGDNEAGISLLKMLNGKLHIILGNHDTESRIELYKTLKNVIEICYAIQLKYKKAYFFLCHYPVITANFDDQLPWAKHLINLFGHTHQQYTFYNDNLYMYNVGLDAHNCYPVSIEQIIEDIKNEKDKINRIKNKKGEEKCQNKEIF